MEAPPSLHDMHLHFCGEDLPISGGSGGSRTDPIVINSPDPEIVARTQMRLLRGIKRARGVYWRCLGRELLGDPFAGIEKFNVETIELTPDQKVTETAGYYFDVSCVSEKDWKPIKACEVLERLNVRFPYEIDWLHLTSNTDHEPATPGLGFSLAYGAPGVTGTLYIYDRKRDVPNDPMHPSVQSEFEISVNEVVERLPDAVAWPDPPFNGVYLQRLFKLREDARDCTMIALTTHRGYFVKMRVSWERDEFIDKVAIGWITATLVTTFDAQSSIIPPK